MMTTKHNQLAALAVLATVTLTACSSDSDTETQSVIDWSQCDADPLECATISVPVNYQNRDGESTEIALIRHASSATTPLGSLLFNPGGPGGSGVNLVQEFYAHLPDSILENYHIVGFDPRGIGDSNPVDCSEFGLEDINDYPRNAGQIEEVRQSYFNFANDCSDKYGDYLQHLGSLNVARDMEEIRIALNEPQLNFIGYSYGTRLAALYLQEFPSNSGRIILDASVSPRSEIITLLKEALPSMQANLTAVLSRCIEFDPNCDVNTLNNLLVEQVESLFEDPSSEYELEILGETVIIATLEPEIGQMLAAPLIEYLMSKDISDLESVIETMFESEEDDDSNDDDNETAQIAILCADDATRYDTQDLVNTYNELNQISDLFAELQMAELAMCSGWPQALEPLSDIATSTAPASLVIGGTSDAQTPLQWSEEMAQQIGGVYIRSEHAGHTSVFNDESDCVDALAEDFLINGVTPANTVCTE